MARAKKQRVRKRRSWFARLPARVGIYAVVLTSILLAVVAYAHVRCMYWHHYAAIAVESKPSERKLRAAMQFNFDPAEATPYMRELHQVVWKNMLLTGSRKGRRIACAQLASYNTGADGVMAVRCLFRIMLSSSQPHDVRSAAENYVAELYAGGGPVIRRYVKRRLSTVIRNGNERAAFLADFITGESVPVQPPAQNKAMRRDS